MSRAELKVAIKEGKIKAKQEKEAYEQALNKLPPEARLEVEQLQKKMAEKNISPNEKQAISDRIISIFEQYNN